MKAHAIRVAIAAAALVASTAVAFADPAPCAIHPKKGASKQELSSFVRISEADARRVALSSVKDSSRASVKESELEAEHGCLVYSFDIAIAGTPGIQEILVDAGDGKILSSEHESPKAEAAEKARDKSSRKP